MHESGIWWIGLALLVLAVFPGVLYAFFALVVLDRKSQGLVDDLKYSKAFDIQPLREQLVDEESVRAAMKVRYGYKRFFWPVTLVMLFNLVGFSIIWDLLRQRFPAAQVSLGGLYTPAFLGAAELPMMAFLGVAVFNYGHMLRRLYLWDVTTQVFWNALHRTWLVMAVAAVLAASNPFTPSAPPEAPPASHLHIVFFSIGFIVNEVVAWMLDRARIRFQVQRMKVEELPLSLIQGINYWHAYRLGEEGVENAQNLATCDILELAVATRYNLRMLLDWVDQAILIHRMGQKAPKLRDAGFITGAIDMAWASPLNGDREGRIAAQVAKTVDVEPIYISTLMNSLYQDAQVQMLWNLWQSSLDSRKEGPPV